MCPIPTRGGPIPSRDAGPATTSLEEARRLLSSTGTARHAEAIGHAPIYRWYEETGDSSAKARVLDAAETVLAEGDEDEHAFAVWVLALDPSRERLGRLTELYATRGWDSRHPLAGFFAWRDLAP